MRKQICRTILCTISLVLVSGQTAVNLPKQSKDPDFSSFSGTKPVQTGTALPATCTTGQLFFLAGAAGSNVYGCTSTNTWSLEAGGSGGSGGASVASQLGDFAVTRTSSAVLTIAAACTSATPCNIRFGTQVYTFLSGGTVTLSSGTGTAYIYISSTGVLTVGHNVTATCSSGCTTQSGVTAFPLNSLPLFTWTATSGAWSATGADFRAFLSTQTLASGAGIQLTQTPGQNTLQTDPTVVGLRVAVPSTSSSSCVAGTWATDGTYYYLCVNTNTWMRALLETF